MATLSKRGRGYHSISIGVVVLASALLGACGGSGGTTSTRAVSSTSTTSSTPQNAAGSTEISPGIVRTSSGNVTATMHAATHHPHVNGRWPIAFVVARGGKPAKAEVAYEYLFGGQVVAHRSHYRFTGSFHDIFIWPSSAVGYPLTFRAVITAGGATVNLDYPVQVVG
jgi:hypothetical protein